MFRLSKATRAAAFDRHPYAQQVIGELTDLRKITRDDLFGHYQEYYTPANAVLSVVGDFDTEKVVKEITQKYGSIPGKSLISYPKVEPEDTISKCEHIKVNGPGDAVYVQISYRAPSAVNEDFFALMVLDSLLTGPTSLSMFGGGSISNKTSRLYKRLVENDLSVSVSGGLQATIDPFLYDILAISVPDKGVRNIINTITEEIDRIQNNSVTQAEIDRAIKQAKALFAYGSESITNQAFWLGYASMFADYSWFDDFIIKLEGITKEHIQSAARKYLDSEHRIIGIYYPNQMENEKNGG
jgi:zinc protease